MKSFAVLLYFFEKAGEGPWCWNTNNVPDKWTETLWCAISKKTVRSSSKDKKDSTNERFET